MRGSAAFMTTRLSGAVLSFALTPLILGYMGKEQFGLWAILGSAVGYVSMFDMGLSQSFTRFLAEKRATVPHEVSRLFYFGVTFYAVLGCVLVPIAYLVGDELVAWMGVAPELAETAYWAFVVMVGYFAVTNLGALGRSSLDALQRVDLGQSLSLLGVIVYWSLGTALVITGWGVWGLVSSAMVGQFAVMVSAWIILRRLWPELLVWRGIARLAEVRRLMRFGVGLQVGASATTVNLETDRLVIGKFVTIDAVANYELGNMLARMVRVLPQAFLHSALPIITEMESTGRGAEIRERVEKFSVVYSGFGFFLAGGMACLAPVLLSFWIGSPQPASAAVLAILAPGWAFVSATGVATTVMRARGQVRTEAAFTSLMALFNVGVTVLLVRPFGMLGVVAGTSMGAVLASMIFLRLFCRSEGRSYLPHVREVVGRPLLVTLIAVGLVTTMLSMLGVQYGVEGRIAALGYLLPIAVLYVAIWAISAVWLRVLPPGDIRDVVGRLKPSGD